jgi:hypothetical protein
MRHTALLFATSQRAGIGKIFFELDFVSFIPFLDLYILVILRRRRTNHEARVRGAYMPEIGTEYSN